MKNNNLQPINFPAGTASPVKVLMYTKSKFPKVVVYLVAEDGKETPQPTLCPTFKKDEDGYVTYFTVELPGETTTENYLITVK